MPNSSLINIIGGFSPSDKLKGLELLQKHIDIDPSLSQDFKDILKRRGIDLTGIFDPGFFPVKSNPVNPTPSTPEQPALEIDTKLQLLISSIPIANPGNIITSEYHNALRDAVRALASKIGLSVNPTAEFKILTFSPNFLPLKIKDSAAVNWDVTLNRAATPQVGAADLNRSVIGGFIVQLPDSATISQMIVRGKRLGASAPNPKIFQVSLNRLKFGSELSSESTLVLDDLKLISMDLNNIEAGLFEKKEGVKLSKKEADLSNNELLARLNISDREIVNNEVWMYFVTADWTAGVKEAAQFEINSIQILCRI